MVDYYEVLVCKAMPHMRILKELTAVSSGGGRGHRLSGSGFTFWRPSEDLRAFFSGRGLYSFDFCEDLFGEPKGRSRGLRSFP